MILKESLEKQRFLSLSWKKTFLWIDKNQVLRRQKGI
jgi:hypothetical protein